MITYNNYEKYTESNKWKYIHNIVQIQKVHHPTKQNLGIWIAQCIHLLWDILQVSYFQIMAKNAKFGFNLLLGSGFIQYTKKPTIDLI